MTSETHEERFHLDWYRRAMVTCGHGCRDNRLRVMCYNIFHAVGQDNQLNLTRTAQVIRNQKVDIVGLQVPDTDASTSSISWRSHLYRSDLSKLLRAGDQMLHRLYMVNLHFVPRYRESFHLRFIADSRRLCDCMHVKEAVTVQADGQRVCQSEASPGYPKLSARLKGCCCVHCPGGGQRIQLPQVRLFIMIRIRRDAAVWQAAAYDLCAIYVTEDGCYMTVTCGTLPTHSAVPPALQQLHRGGQGAGRPAGLELRLRRQPEPDAPGRHPAAVCQPPVRHRHPDAVGAARGS